MKHISCMQTQLPSNEVGMLMADCIDFGLIEDVIQCMHHFCADKVEANGKVTATVFTLKQ